MSKMRRLLPFVMIICLLFLPPVALAADSFTVYVGYADNLRASGFFPTPWLGSPNVVSQTPSGQTLDTGAIRIDNTGANPISITNLAVKFNGGSVVINIWSSLTLNPGQTGIFTQTTSFNFDTSDFGIFGGLPPSSLAPTIPGNNQIGGCSSTAPILTASGDKALCAANAPVVSFMENGTPFSATDTGQILNTGGWDFVNNGAFGGDGNESINWNLIGSGASRGGTITFSAFCAELEISKDKDKDKDKDDANRFELHSRFMLGAKSDGIDPVTEPVILQLGTFSTTIPGGSFTKTMKGNFVFEGVINGERLEVRIKPLDKNSFTFSAEGKGVDLSALTAPVTVVLTIGDDAGTTPAFKEEEEGEGERSRDH